MDLNPQNSWEQFEGEPDAAYVRFLYYLNLGPTRSLDRAYSIYLNSADYEPPVRNNTEKGIVKARKGNTYHRAPGSWQREAVIYSWEFRANQYDISVLSGSGRATIDNFYKALANLSAQMLELFQARTLQPKSFEELLEGMLLVGSYITPESLSAWRELANIDTSKQTGPESGPPGSGNISSIRDRKRA